MRFLQKKLWGGGAVQYSIGGKIFEAGYTFLVCGCIFINKVCENLGGRVHLYPLISLPSPRPRPRPSAPGPRPPAPSGPCASVSMDLKE
jgi:hypothetical protein